MLRSEIAHYLANLILVSQADGATSAVEESALDVVLLDLGADHTDFNQAMDLIKGGYEKMILVGRFSDRVRNFEDMILVCLADGSIPPEERQTVLDFAQKIGLTNPQIKVVMGEAKQRAKILRTRLSCPSCNQTVAPDSIFCPHCGRKIQG